MVSHLILPGSHVCETKIFHMNTSASGPARQGGIEFSLMSFFVFQMLIKQCKNICSDDAFSLFIVKKEYWSKNICPAIWQTFWVNWDRRFYERGIEIISPSWANPPSRANFPHTFNLENQLIVNRTFELKKDGTFSDMFCVRRSSQLMCSIKSCS